MIGTVRRILLSLEEATEGVASSFLVAASFFVVRGFLESFSISQLSQTFLLLRVYDFYLGSYFASLLLIGFLVVKALTKTTTARASSVVAVGTASFLLVPLVDILWYRGQTPLVDFARLTDVITLCKYFLTFGSGYAGVTLGLQVEVAMLVVGIGLYVASATRSVLRGLLASASIYVATMTYASLPTLLFLLSKDANLLAASQEQLAPFFLCSTVLLTARAFRIRGSHAGLLCCLPLAAAAAWMVATGQLAATPIIAATLGTLVVSFYCTVVAGKPTPRIVFAVLFVAGAYLLSPVTALIAGLLVAPLAYVHASAAAPAKLTALVVAGATPLIFLSQQPLDVEHLASMLALVASGAALLWLAASVQRLVRPHFTTP